MQDTCVALSELGRALAITPLIITKSPTERLWLGLLARPNAHYGTVIVYEAPPSLITLNELGKTCITLPDKDLWLLAAHYPFPTAFNPNEVVPAISIGTDINPPGPTINVSAPAGPVALDAPDPSEPDGSAGLDPLGPD